jgi:hypothetical protein
MADQPADDLEAQLAGWDFGTTTKTTGDSGDEQGQAVVQRVKSKMANDGDFAGCGKPETNSQIYRALEMTRKEFKAMTTDPASELGQVFVPFWTEYVEGYLSKRKKTGKKGSELTTILAFLDTDAFEDTLRHRMPAPGNRKHWGESEWDAFLYFKIRSMLYDGQDSHLKRLGFTQPQAQRMAWDLKINRCAQHAQSKAGRKESTRESSESGAFTDTPMEQAQGNPTGDQSATAGASTGPMVDPALGPITPDKQTAKGKGKGKAAKAPKTISALMDSARQQANMKPAIKAKSRRKDGTIRDDGESDESEDDEPMETPSKGPIEMKLTKESIALQDIQIMKNACPLAAEVDADVNACNCRFHMYRLAQRVCGGKLGVEDLRQRLGEFVVTETETDAEKTTEQLAAEPEVGDNGLMQQQHTVEDAQRNADWQKKIDSLAAGSSYTIQQLSNAAKVLGTVGDTLKVADTQFELHWWQVVHAAELERRFRSGEGKGAILADQVGMGKTFTVLSFLKVHADRVFKEYHSAVREWEKSGKVGPEPAAPKPVLLAVPSGLVKQWSKETKKYSKAFRVITYYGDIRGRNTSSRFKKDDVRFDHRFGKNKYDEDQLVLILTTHDTWRGRHGPKSLYTHRHGKTPKGWGKQEILTPVPTKEDHWQHDMSDQFAILVVDEAHVVRNPYRQANQSLKWLNVDFTVLMTATPIWGHAGNLTGLLTLVEERGLSAAAEADLGKNTDPWMLDDEDERAEYRYSAYAWERFCLGDANLADAVIQSTDPDIETVGGRSLVGEQARRLKAIFAQYIIRADYNSECEGLGKAGEQIPARIVYHVQTEFGPDAKKLYIHVADKYLHKLHVKNPTTQKVMLNGLKLRMLYLTALNPVFEFSPLLTDINGTLRKMGAGEAKLTYKLAGTITAELRFSDSLKETCADLQIVPFTRDTIEEPNMKMSVVETVLSTILGYSVRLRAVIAVVADQVIRCQEKAILWVQYPVEQKLLVAVLDCLNIRARALLASLTPRQRSRLIDDFNLPTLDSVQVLVCSYKVSITGHNMQGACRYVHLVDPAPTESTMHQVIGRVQRLGQRKMVHVTQYMTPETHNTTTTIRSAAQIASAVLASINTDALLQVFGYKDISEEDADQIGRHEGFATVNGDLWHRSHPGFEHVCAGRPGEPTPVVEYLNAGDFGIWITTQQRGAQRFLSQGVGSEFISARTDSGGQTALGDDIRRLFTETLTDAAPRQAGQGEDDGEGGGGKTWNGEDMDRDVVLSDSEDEEQAEGTTDAEASVQVETPKKRKKAGGKKAAARKKSNVGLDD